MLDLATARPVELRLLRPCAPADEKAWAARCTQLSTVWHEDLPALIDFGLHPEGRFEAYEASAASRWSPQSAKAISAFLEELDGRRPAGRWPELASPSSGFARRPRLGIHLLGHPALAHLLELLDEGRTGRPLSVACVGERGSGRRTFVRQAAAGARARGYVPLAVAMVDRFPALRKAVEGRHVMLIARPEDPSTVTELLWLRLCAATPNGHLRLQICETKPVGADLVLTLAPCAPDRLSAAVRWHPPAGLTAGQVRRAAAEAGGLPGRLIASLGHVAEHAALKVAEARAAYRIPPLPEDSEIEHPWADLLADARRAARQGQRAAAERTLRQIGGAARRRQVTAAAAAAETELGWLRLARGRADEARALFAAVLEEDRAVSVRVDAALGLAEAHLACGALEQAEATLRGARAADPTRVAVSLARCFRIQGRREEASRVLDPVVAHDAERTRGRGTAVLARLMLAGEDLPGAARLGAQALSAAGRAADPLLACSAHEILAAVHARVLDPAAAASHADRAVAAARVARWPVRELLARAARLECLQQCGQPVDRRTIERLLRIAEQMPALVRARLWRCAGRVLGSGRERDSYAARAEEFARAVGAASWLASARGSDAQQTTIDVESLLRLQAEVRDPRRAATLTLEWVRERLAARSTHLLDESGTVVARAGPADPIGAARRVLATRAAQPPWVGTEGLEAAVTVRVATGVRGALGCRWTLDRTPPPEAIPLLGIAAAVLAPSLLELAERATRMTDGPERDGIVGRSPAVVRLREAIVRAGAAPFGVLIEGESGVGKELVARAIHAASPRRARPFVALNCAALSDELFEAELFGHARGAFTGAHADRPGLFEQADGGTLFLDEISELSPRGQAKLLRALQEGELRRVGENIVRRVDVRAVAASNRRLQAEVAQGRFRQDLLFRLAVVTIAVPALRDRVEDIPLLVAHYWQQAAERAGSRAVPGAEAVAALCRHAWPGNVRELQNVMAALAVQNPRGRLEEEHVAALIGTAVREPAVGTLDEVRTAFEREFVATVLARCGGRQSQAARELGVSRQGLAKLLKRLAIA